MDSTSFLKKNISKNQNKALYNIMKQKNQNIF